MRTLDDHLKTLKAHKTYAERMEIIWLWVKTGEADLTRFKVLVRMMMLEERADVG